MRGGLAHNALAAFVAVVALLVPGASCGWSSSISGRSEAVATSSSRKTQSSSSAGGALLRGQLDGRLDDEPGKAVQVDSSLTPR